jgi:hypothetical protein
MDDQLPSIDVALLATVVPPLRGAHTTVRDTIRGVSELPYLNAVLVRGAEKNGVYFQRTPVPLGMLKPFSGAGVPLNLAGPGVMRIGRERVAIWVCHEVLLVLPSFIPWLNDRL